MDILSWRGSSGAHSQCQDLLGQHTVRSKLKDPASLWKLSHCYRKASFSMCLIPDPLTPRRQRVIRASLGMMAWHLRGFNWLGMTGKELFFLERGSWFSEPVRDDSGSLRFYKPGRCDEKRIARSFFFFSERDEIGSVLTLELSAQKLSFPESTVRRPWRISKDSHEVLLLILLLLFLFLPLLLPSSLHLLFLLLTLLSLKISWIILNLHLNFPIFSGTFFRASNTDNQCPVCLDKCPLALSYSIKFWSWTEPFQFWALKGAYSDEGSQRHQTLCYH